MTKSRIHRLIISGIIVAALSTYFSPVIRVTLPAIGSFNWSVHDLVRPAFKQAMHQLTHSKPKSSAKKEKTSFFEVLQKILPKNKENKPTKVSTTFVFGILVPVALFLSYLILLACLAVVWAKKAWTMRICAKLALIASVYVLVGTFYLGFEAQRSFAETVDKAANGVFGFIAKNFVAEITIKPDTGLYFLVAFVAILSVSSWIFPVKK